ncbi:hypothetical protein V6N11_016924 [Hibiscus sabdariffa]|uniref:Uncharacterized protein n=1 Tax=Hibiscus sabdariffa TaxID=183260 RepID=A0ABR2TWU0_9ROSI
MPELELRHDDGYQRGHRPSGPPQTRDSSEVRSHVRRQRDWDRPSSHQGPARSQREQREGGVPEPELPNGKIEGVLNFSYKFGDTFTIPAVPPPPPVSAHPPPPSQGMDKSASPPPAGYLPYEYPPMQRAH